MRWIENSIYKEFPFLPAFATTKWQNIDSVHVWMFAHVYICVQVFEEVSESHVIPESPPY